MAWTNTALPADEVASAANDKPLLSGLNYARTARADGEIVWSDADATYPATDESDADGPASLVGDDRVDLQSFPDAADTNFYLHLYFGGIEATVDTVVIANHNLGTINATLRIVLADNGSYTGNAVTVLPGTVITDDARLSYLKLGAGRRYTGVTHARFQIEPSPSALPRIGEIWIGERQQLNHKPDEPWQYDSVGYSADTWETVNGAHVNYVRHDGQRLFSAVMVSNSTTYETRLKSWRKGCAHGAKPFLWVDDPETTPESAHIMRATSPISAETRGPVARVFGVDAREVGPPFVTNENDV